MWEVFGKTEVYCCELSKEIVLPLLLFMCLKSFLPSQLHSISLQRQRQSLYPDSQLSVTCRLWLFLYLDFGGPASHSRLSSQSTHIKLRSPLSRLLSFSSFHPHFTYVRDLLLGMGDTGCSSTASGAPGEYRGLSQALCAPSGASDVSSFLLLPLGACIMGLAWIFWDCSSAVL